jgi:hypothetical protein
VLRGRKGRQGMEGGGGGWAKVGVVDERQDGGQAALLERLLPGTVVNWRCDRYLRRHQ